MAPTTPATLPESDRAEHEHVMEGLEVDGDDTAAFLEYLEATLGLESDEIEAMWQNSWQLEMLTEMFCIHEARRNGTLPDLR